MQIVLYKNTAEKERLDKTLYLTEIMSMVGTLRAPSSVVSPVILLELPMIGASSVIDGDGADVVDGDGGELLAGANDSLLDFNYCYIPEFRRYYFVTNVSITNSKLYAISLSVDTLMSYKSEILALSCQVSRCESRFDVMELDALLPLQYVKQVSETTPPEGAAVNTHFDTALGDSDRNKILTLVSEYPRSNDDINPPSGSSMLPIIDSDRFTAKRSSMRYLIDDWTLAMMGKGLLNDYSTFIDFIKSVIAFPFKLTPAPSDYELDLYFGAWKEERRMFVNGAYLKGYTYNPMSGYLVVGDFYMPTASSFLDYSPYSRYELFVPFYGWVELNYQACAGHRILVYYAVNYEDGSATAFVYDATMEIALFSTACQLGMKLGLSSSNQQQIIAQKNAENTNLAIGLLSSAASVAGGILSENPMMIAGGVLGATKAVTGYVNANAMMFERSTASFSDSATAMYTRLQVRLRITRQAQIDTDMVGYSHSFGRPLHKYLPLGDCHGFTIGENVHLDGVSAYESEASEIKAFIETGIILP